MVLDCRNKACPQPVVLSLQALRNTESGETIQVIVDNMAAVENLSRMAKEKHCELNVQEGEGIWTLSLTKKVEAEDVAVKHADSVNTKTSNGTGTANVTNQKNSQSDVYVKEAKSGNTVIAIGTDRMGQGNEELGKNLLKGYIYALNQLEDADLPTTILFFNGGAYLTTKGAQTLSDLADLKERGVKIYTCGACLDFYGLKEDLLVGEITNMYSINEYMIKADKVIRI